MSHKHRAESGISLIIPAYNEEAGIAAMIAAAASGLAAVTSDFEIIVVDDGSSDATFVNATEASKEHSQVRILRHETNLGYGAAIRSGFAAAKKELLVFTDADIQFDLTELPRFILLASDYDIVCGYRIDRQDAWLRKTYSKCYNLLVRTLLGIQVRDIDCAFKLFHRRDREKLSISTNGFLVNAEMLTKAQQNSLSIVEVGVTHLPRVLGHSSVSAAHILPVLVGLIRFWWNRMMFVGRPEPAVRPSAAWTWGAAALVFLAAVVLFTNLSFPLIDRDETRYAEIPREMLATGNWLSPQLNFETYYDKPPLLYWLCAASYKAFGVSEWSARIVPATSAFLLLIATMWFGARMFDQRVSTISGIVLMSTTGFLFSGRYLLIDGLLSLLVALSLFTCYESIRGGIFKWKWWIGSAVFCGLGVLAKGPVAGVLFGPPVFVFAWLTHSSARIRLHHWLAFAGTVFAVASPWFVMAALHDPRFLYEFFYKHNITRFAGAYHAEPTWFFIPVALIGGHPWTFLLIPYGIFLTRRTREAGRMRPPAQAFLLLWVVWCVLFFSMSKGKLATYIIPAIPAYALLVAHYLDHALFQSPQSNLFAMAKWLSPWLAAATTCVAGIFLGVAALAMKLTTSAAFALTLSGWIALSFLLLYAYIKHSSSWVSWGLSTIVALVLVFHGTHLVLPQLGQTDTLIMPSTQIAKWTADKDKIVATFGHEWSGVPFYSNRNDIENFQSSHGQELAEFLQACRSSIVVVRGALQMENLRNQLPADVRMTVLEQSSNTFVAATEHTSENRTAAKHPKPLNR